MKLEKIYIFISSLPGLTYVININYLFGRKLSNYILILVHYTPWSILST